MDVGLSIDSQIPGLAGPELIAWIDERAAAAKRSGLASLHVGDKHGTSGAYAANFALAGRLGARWPRRLGLLVVSTLWNPVLLAEQIATLAASVERLDVVVALGDGEDHFGSVGLTTDGRLRRFLDGLAVTRALIAGENVTTNFDGLSIRNARVHMATGCYVSWLIGATAPVAIRRAAALGVGWVGSAKLPGSEALEALDCYRQAGGVGRAILRREVFVGESAAQVEQLVEPAILAGYRGYPPEALVRGDRDAVAEHLLRLQNAGFDEMLGRSLLSHDRARSLESIRRLGELARTVGSPS